MNLTTAQYDRISRFLDAEMTWEEMDAFEKELAGSPEMREQLAFEQAIRDHISRPEPTTATIPAAAPISKEKSSAKVIALRKWAAIGIAASVLLVLLLLLFRTKTPDTPPLVKGPDTLKNKSIVPTPISSSPPHDSDRNAHPGLLFEKYFTKDGLPEESPILLADALADYETGNYAAIRRFDPASVTDTRGTDAVNSKKNILQVAHYYKAISYLQTGNTKQAIIHLQWVIGHAENRALVEKARWYLSLAYLRNGRTEEAIGLLSVLIRNNDSKDLIPKAEKLRDELK